MVLVVEWVGKAGTGQPPAACLFPFGSGNDKRGDLLFNALRNRFWFLVPEALCLLRSAECCVIANRFATKKTILSGRVSDNNINNCKHVTCQLVERTASLATGRLILFVSDGLCIIIGEKQINLL